MPPSRRDDLDLTEALREREALREAGEQRRRSHASGRRPAIRTGGRVRMDAPRSNHGGARHFPVPGPPRRRRNRRLPNWRAVALWALAGIGAAAGLIYLFTTPELAIRNVEFEGVTGVQAAALQSIVPVDPIGHNLLAYAVLHGHAAQSTIVSSEADFKSVRIGIRPPHTLTVVVSQRVPYALLAVGPAGSQGVWVLDDRGVPIRNGHDRGSRPLGIAKIMASGGVGLPSSGQVDVVTLGQPLTGALNDQVTTAFTLLAALRGRSDVGQVSSVQVDNSLDLGLNRSDHLQIRLGQSDQLSQKLSIVGSLVAQHPELATQARYIDVSYPARPAMMPRGYVAPVIAVKKPAEPAVAVTKPDAAQPAAQSTDSAEAQ